MCIADAGSIKTPVLKAFVDTTRSRHNELEVSFFELVRRRYKVQMIRFLKINIFVHFGLYLYSFFNDDSSPPVIFYFVSTSIGFIAIPMMQIITTKSNSRQVLLYCFFKLKS